MTNKELYNYLVNKEGKEEDEIQRTVREALAAQDKEIHHRPFLDLDNLCD